MEKEKAEKAVKKIAELRDGKKLPFPDFHQEDISSFKGSIEYPPPESALRKEDEPDREIASRRDGGAIRTTVTPLTGRSTLRKTMSGKIHQSGTSNQIHEQVSPSRNRVLLVKE